jgi:hypothetical protein
MVSTGLLMISCILMRDGCCRRCATAGGRLLVADLKDSREGCTISGRPRKNLALGAGRDVEHARANGAGGDDLCQRGLDCRPEPSAHDSHAVLATDLLLLHAVEPITIGELAA